jgi:hypothetical protein
MNETAKEVAERDARRKKHREEYHAFRHALNNIAKTKDGEVVLRHMAKLSGFFVTLTVKKGGVGIFNGIDCESMLVHSGRRDLYIDFRRAMTEETRRLIEARPTEEENEHE